MAGAEFELLDSLKLGLIKTKNVMCPELDDNKYYHNIDIVSYEIAEGDKGKQVSFEPIELGKLQQNHLEDSIVYYPQRPEKVIISNIKKAIYCTAYKLADEWFYINVLCSEGHQRRCYKADQFDGLTELLNATFYTEVEF